MSLEDILSQKKDAIAERWFNLILQTYPADTSRFLKGEKDRFANPVGSTISLGVDTLYGELLQERMDHAKISAALDSIIRIRSIQDFSPSQAIAFVFLLKRAIREELGNGIQDDRIFGELLKIESRIDELAFLAFDIYVKCREEIYQLRVNEAKAHREIALEVLGKVNMSYNELEREYENLKEKTKGLYI